MNNTVLPPGNILQNMYFKERIKRNEWSSFFEVGSGNGYLSKLMLDFGLEGKGCDMNKSACLNNQCLNLDYINQGKYSVSQMDFFDTNSQEKFDIVFACMVIEHLDGNKI